MMPRLDGWAVLKELKADPELSPIPVIMLTVVDDRNMAYVLGAAAFLDKPIDRARLAAVLEKHRPAPGGTVLIVEDDARVRQVLRKSVVEQGCRAVEASNGAEALRELARARPDLILLDLVMPGIDGFELASRLRADERWRTIPVVVLTAKDLTAADRDRLRGNVRRVMAKSGRGRDALLREVAEALQSTLAPRGASGAGRGAESQE
jgi:CheY-like chemotaxis protein